MGGWINPLQTLPQGLVFTFDFDPDPDPELDNITCQYIDIYYYLFNLKFVICKILNSVKVFQFA